MTTLTRTLTLRDLTLLIIGLVIGSGIFTVPAVVLSQMDRSVGPALLVWLAGGVLSLLGALTYGELSAGNPQAGGLYIYIRDCFGRFPAFLYGWTLFFLIASGSVATLAVAFSAYLRQIIPVSDPVMKVVSIAVIAVVAAVNVRGTRQSADLQNWTTAIKVGAILVMSAVLLWAGSGYSGTREALWPTALTGSLASNFGVAMISVLWAYEGWQYVTFSAGETVDAQRNFPRAFLVGTVALAVIYMLANVAYLAALGPAGTAASDRVASASIAAVVGPEAAKLVAIAILISMFSAANSVVLTAPRVYYAMANDGLFFKRLAEVHPRFRTPAFAVLAGSVWSAVLASSATFQQLLTYVVFAGWIFYGLAAATIFVYRKRNGVAALPYRVPGYPWTPLLFVVAAVALVGNTVVRQPREAAVGIGILLLGAPVYFIWRRRVPRM